MSPFARQGYYNPNTPTAKLATAATMLIAPDSAPGRIGTFETAATRNVSPAITTESIQAEVAAVQSGIANNSTRLLAAPPQAVALLPENAASILAKSRVWSLGPGPRGLAIESQLGGNLPAGFRVIDRFENGVATSIKSIDLNAATYQNAQALGSRLNGYVDSLEGWTGQTTPYARVVIKPSAVTVKTLQIAVPPGSMSAAQQAVFNAAGQRAQAAGINFIITPVP